MISNKFSVIRELFLVFILLLASAGASREVLNVQNRKAYDVMEHRKLADRAQPPEGGNPIHGTESRS
ncbi:hypothetical protein FEM48_Zijuj10G0071600 [Ziziphus jujuba var. spinosa]|uniref:Uncharacterized protein n=1 Tax=Ziziphus jujuba var. spinosa TaxID=714518 RepID=A0A978UM11_ZIZJJ|nr:hypothetical protein FEM48_Zijuj10G0071600 [Ziziphus jujuba var. spinosa]